MAAEIIILCTSEDLNTAYEIESMLNSKGFTCAILNADLKPQNPVEILEAVGSSKAVMLINSASANKSAMMAKLVELAIRKNVPVINYETEQKPTDEKIYNFNSSHAYNSNNHDKLAHDLAAFIPSQGGRTMGNNIEGTERKQTTQDQVVTSDLVHFSITSPTSVLPGTSFVINVWAHMDQQRKEVLERAREFSTDGDIKTQSKGPFKVSRGVVFTIRMELAGLILEDPVDTIVWEGEIGNATFFATIPREYNQGSVNGRVMVYIEGLQIAKIPFLITISNDKSNELTQTEAIRHRTAFASYASGDQDDVLARIHGIQKAVPDLEIFFDKKSLRSGQQWEQELWRVIEGSDVFYLFWSKNASESEWVEKEWRYALTTRGLDFIDPVPLVSPQIAPPPKELEKLHFNDWVLSFIKKD